MFGFSRMNIIQRLILSIMFAGTAFAEIDLPQVFPAKDDFTLRLPNGWIAIPKDILDAHSEGIAEMVPQAPKQVFDYGFQLEQSEYWLEYPYILVRVDRSGRISDAQLRSFRKLEDAFSDAEEKKMQDLLSPLISSIEYGEFLYDSSSHILWRQVVMDVRGVGEIKGLVALLLTEFGAIQIMGYAKANDFEYYAPVFEAIAKNVFLSDNIKYRPCLIDSLPAPLRGVDWERIVMNVTASVIIIGIVGVIIMLIEKIKTGKG